VDLSGCHNFLSVVVNSFINFEEPGGLEQSVRKGRKTMRVNTNSVGSRVLLAGFLLFLTVFGGIAVAAQTTATVNVDCTKGKSINKALDQHKNAQSLIVEIEGMCNENVIVTRDRVTLRGANPATDGIQAVLNATQMDAALWIRGAHQVVVEKLKLTGGFTGLLATEASTPSLRMVNCRLEGNAAFGVALEGSLLEAEDTVLTANGNFNAGVFQSSRFACLRCTLSDPVGSGALGTQRNNILALNGPSVLLFESTLTNGGIQLTNALLQASDTTIDAHPPDASVSGAQSTVVLTRVQLGGLMRFNQSTSATLLGVTQFRSETLNVVGDNSFVRIGDASPASGGPPTIPSAVMGFSLQNFSNGSLFQTSQINGNVSCGSGANVFCANPANVSGTSNCALCPKP
jgi:hypothetical protein